MTQSQKNYSIAVNKAATKFNMPVETLKKYMKDYKSCPDVATEKAVRYAWIWIRYLGNAKGKG